MNIFNIVLSLISGTMGNLAKLEISRFSLDDLSDVLKSLQELDQFLSKWTSEFVKRWND